MDADKNVQSCSMSKPERHTRDGPISSAKTGILIEGLAKPISQTVAAVADKTPENHQSGVLQAGGQIRDRTKEG